MPTYDASPGLRLLLIFVVLEGVIGPRLSLFRWLHFPLPPVWLRVPVLLVFALLLVRFFAGLNLSQIGLYRWREWSGTEKSTDELDSIGDSARVVGNPEVMEQIGSHGITSAYPVIRQEFSKALISRPALTLV